MTNLSASVPRIDSALESLRQAKKSLYHTEREYQMNLYRLTKTTPPGFTLDASDIYDIRHMLDAHICDECKDECKFEHVHTDIGTVEALMATQCGLEFVLEKYQRID